MEKVTDKFSTREKVALKLITILLVVLKPTQWSHDYTNELREVKKLIDENIL